MSKEYSYTVEEDKDIEVWVNCLLRAKIANINIDQIYCIGPAGNKHIVIEDQKICTNKITIFTYYKTNFIAFCDRHLSILLQYFEYLSKRRKSHDLDKRN